MKEFNILFTSAGRRVSLIRHFKKTLQELDLAGKIITADLTKTAPSVYIGDLFEPLPPINSPGYIPAVMDICKKHNITLLIPLLDTELSVLAQHKKDFEAIKVTVLVSSPEVNNICFNKRKTHEFFSNAGVDTPALFVPEMILKDTRAEFPFFLKPAEGSSSIGATKINNRKELAFFNNHVIDPILQEYVTGEEYTLDVLVAFDGSVRSVVPRLRLETRAGEVSKGMTVKNHSIIAAGKKVVEALPGAVGCITVQCFLTPAKEIKFIEINPRFGGGFPLSIEAGADFPRWIIEMMIGLKRDIKLDQWQENIIMLRYDDAIYVTKDQIYD